MTYADLIDTARRDWLAPLAALPMQPPLDGVIFKPLGGSLMLRWLRNPNLDLERTDPVARYVAHDMLDRWIAACQDDPSRLPWECAGMLPPEAARCALRLFFERQWAR